MNDQLNQSLEELNLRLTDTSSPGENHANQSMDETPYVSTTSSLHSDSDIEEPEG
jgi:hypothetical protein